MIENPRLHDSLLMDQVGFDLIRAKLVREQKTRAPYCTTDSYYDTAKSILFVIKSDRSNNGPFCYYKL